MRDKDTLTGETVADARGAKYTVKKHHIEADELVLERGGVVKTAITMMDIADGPYEVVDE